MHCPRPLFLAPLALLAVAACQSQGAFPSLAPRPIERELPGVDRAPPQAVVPDDPALPARLRAFAAAGRQGQAEFATALAAARTAVGHAGPPGSDSWVGAQQALSRVEAAAAPTARALADLDAFVVDLAKTHPLSPADLDRIHEAEAGLQAIADAQRQQMAALQARLKA